MRKHSGNYWKLVSGTFGGMEKKCRNSAGNDRVYPRDVLPGSNGGSDGGERTERDMARGTLRGPYQQPPKQPTPPKTTKTHTKPPKPSTTIRI